MNLFFIFLSSLLVGLSGAVMPGPLLSVNIYGTLKAGIKGGMSTIVGHSLVEAVTVILLLIGFNQFLSYYSVQGIIGIIGGGVLVWMGAGMLRGSQRVSVEIQKEGSSKNRNYVVSGILASISNPYWYIWWATVGLSYISISRESGIYGPPAFYFGHISSDFIWYGIVTFLVARGVTRINPQIHRIVIFILSIFLIILGAIFVTLGVKKLIA